MPADEKEKLEGKLNALLAKEGEDPPKHSLEVCCASFKELFGGNEQALELITDAFAKAEYNVDAERGSSTSQGRGVEIKDFAGPVPDRKSS